jgi:hypothetical protein
LVIAPTAFLAIFGLYAIGVSLWTKHQLRPGPLGGTCMRDRELVRATAGQWDPRIALARAAIHRAAPDRHWGNLRWHFTFASAEHLGFLFISKKEQIRMLDRLPRCRSKYG